MGKIVHQKFSFIFSLVAIALYFSCSKNHQLSENNFDNQQYSDENRNFFNGLYQLNKLQLSKMSPNLLKFPSNSNYKINSTEAKLNLKDSSEKICPVCDGKGQVYRLGRLSERENLHRGWFQCRKCYGFGTIPNDQYVVPSGALGGGCIIEDVFSDNPAAGSN